MDIGQILSEHGWPGAYFVLTIILAKWMGGRHIKTLDTMDEINATNAGTNRMNAEANSRNADTNERNAELLGAVVTELKEMRRDLDGL